MSNSGNNSTGVLVLLLVAIGISVAYWLTNGNSSPEVSGGQESKDTAKDDPTPDDHGDVVQEPPPRTHPWEEWPKPSFALLLTGEQHGFFEPCGCTANQLGGMSRRADLISKIKSAGWELTGVDLGGLPRRTGTQAGIKLHTSLKALTQLGYMGVGLGVDELKLGIDGLLDVQMQLLNSEDTVRFISANVKLLDGELEEFPVTSRVIEIGGLKLGVTSVVSQSLQHEVFPMGDGEWKTPNAEIDKILSEFAEQSVDVRVLLSHGTVEESKEFARQFPQFQVVLTARGIGDPDPNAAPQSVGNTMVVEAGRKGKHVGVLAAYQSEGRLSFQYKLVSLERDDFGESQPMIDMMKDYQEQLKQNQIVLTDGIGAPHPSQSTYVGVDKCGECHTTAHEIWQKTGHAHAFEDLDPVHKRHGHERLNGVNRSFDPECLSCHVTGWDPQEYTRFKSGFLNEEFASTDEEKQLHKLLAGSQCENCHGPGSRHVELVEAGEDNAGESVRLLKADAKARCEKCHDGDNSPDFEFEAYWKKVEHYGLE